MRNWPRLLALGGIAGPVLFSLIVVICGALRTDYSHLSQFISELGATGSSNAALMNGAGFIPAGLLIALFGIALNAKLQTVLARIGSFLVSIFGLGMSVAGIFSCDPGCALPVTQDASIHNLVSPIIFLSIIVGMIILGLSFRRDPQWKPLWIYSVATGIIAMIFMFVMINSFEARTYTGMWQRLFLLTAFVWMCIVGLRLRSTAGGTLESQAD